MKTFQFCDPSVSRAKFEREVSQFKAFEQDYRKRGWFLIRAEFPKVDVLLAAPQLKPPAIVIGVEFDYTNYDAEAPSVRLVEPFTLVPYKASELPVNLARRAVVPMNGNPNAPGVQLFAQQPLMQAYSPEDIPFLCIAGVREYHAHPGHTGDPWEVHRLAGAGKLVRLLTEIYKYGVEPIAQYNVALIPQVGFGFGQVPE